MLEKLHAEQKSGDEPLTSNGHTLNFTLLDFWKWSVSDILSNATRGRLAEFIVATATRMEKTKVRDEWDAYDIVTMDGIKIEVKSAAYLQSWFQKSYSNISFNIRITGHWDIASNIFYKAEKRRADVYVFCLLSHQDKSTVNPLNLDQWEFYVLATSEVNAHSKSRHSISLKSLRTLTSSVKYEGLYEAIQEKNALNEIAQ